MTGQYSRGGVGYLIVRFEKVYETGTGILGLDGKELIIGDTDYNREKRARIFGTVIQVPISLGKKPISSEKAGFPGYGAIRLPDDMDAQISDAIYSRPKNRIRFMSDIVPDVQLDDRIYCSWTQVFDQRNLLAKSANGKVFVFRVSYDTVYCTVRDEKIIPIGGNVLIDPIWDTWETILKPSYYPFNGPDGKPAVRPKSEWIQVKTAPKTVDREGIITHLGEPLKGDRCTLKPGMRVLFKPNLKNLTEIEGSKYFIVPQNKILLYR